MSAASASVIGLDRTRRLSTHPSLLWEDPPSPVRSRPGQYAAVAAALQERPGEWAVIRTFPPKDRKRAWSFTGVIRQGRLTDLKSGFEACTRSVEGQVRVYARFVGASDE